MPGYVIQVTEEAKNDLSYYAASERKSIAAAIRSQLTHYPLVETRNRKPLRENPVASWELRSEKHRIFYEVDEAIRTVTIVAVGHKVHNVLLIRGKQVQL